MKTAFILALVLVIGPVFVAIANCSISGKVTTWQGDATGQDCTGYQKCDSGEMLCAAPMRNCTCQSGTLKPAKDTSSSNRYKWWCNQGNIDGRALTAADRDKCNSCTLLTCDQWDYPACTPSCGRKICISGIQAYEMDSCPSNHQKNVAKCCIWGGSYCSCVTGNYIDVNGAMMQKLGCGGLCSSATWVFATCPAKASTSCGNSCTNVSPPSDSTTLCSQLAAAGKCNQTSMAGYCCKSCANKVACNIDTSCGTSCADEPPDSTYTCAQQVAWGKCGDSFMAGFCCKSCANKDKCSNSSGSTTGCGTSCNDVPPDSSYSCAQQAAWGKCGESWMTGYCCKTCANQAFCSATTRRTTTKTSTTKTILTTTRRTTTTTTAAAPSPSCGKSCTDISPDGNNSYTCTQQVAWGKCNESWMAGYCCKSCANRNLCNGPCAALPCSNIPPDTVYTCAQQVAWGKCNETWMVGYCCKSCGRC